MYVIISHDVDHLFARDHWFRDLSYPKLWVRSTIQLGRRIISLKEWWLRCSSCFRSKRNNIEEILRFDRSNGIPSTFFFGVNQGLGLSYKALEARDTVIKTHNAGFDVGVHGIVFDSEDGIKKEYNEFVKTMGFEPCGIRMHYVRFDKNTFEYEANAGYRFDSTEFDKKNNGTRKSPYRVGNMWEFPLTIMDGYLPVGLDAMKKATLKLISECEEKQIRFVTILFHDCYFCEDYVELSQWYRWLVGYIKSKEQFTFISFKEAIEQLEMTI